MQMLLVVPSGKALGVLFWNPSDDWIESIPPPPQLCAAISVILDFKFYPSLFLL